MNNIKPRGEALLIQVEVQDLHRLSCRSRRVELRAACLRWCRGWWQAALTNRNVSVLPADAGPPSGRRPGSRPELRGHRRLTAQAPSRQISSVPGRAASQAAKESADRMPAAQRQARAAPPVPGSSPGTCTAFIPAVHPARDGPARRARRLTAGLEACGSGRRDQVTSGHCAGSSLRVLYLLSVHPASVPAW